MYEFIKADKDKKGQLILRYRFKLEPSSSKYKPHQGKQECERRRKQNVR